jgi:hypothetical protein
MLTMDCVTEYDSQLSDEQAKSDKEKLNEFLSAVTSHIHG